MPDVVRVNNTIYSWTSTLFRFDAQPWKGLVALDYSQKRERKIVYAAQQDGKPIGWTSGKYSVDAFTMRFLRDSADALTTYLTVKGLGSYGDAEFNAMVQVVEPVLGSLPLTVSGDPCVIIGKKDVHEEGIDELVTEFEVACLSLTENGKQLWSAVRELAI